MHVHYKNSNSRKRKFHTDLQGEFLYRSKEIGYGRMALLED